MDTRPHAVNPEWVIAEQSESFVVGQGASRISRLSCPRFVAAQSSPRCGARPRSAAEFSGHPAGLAAHVHFLQGASLRSSPGPSTIKT